MIWTSNHLVWNDAVHIRASCHWKTSASVLDVAELQCRLYRDLKSARRIQSPECWPLNHGTHLPKYKVKSSLIVINCHSWTALHYSKDTKTSVSYLHRCIGGTVVSTAPSWEVHRGSILGQCVCYYLQWWMLSGPCAYAVYMFLKEKCLCFRFAMSLKLDLGSTEIWTRITGFKVQSANHYTIEPPTLLYVKRGLIVSICQSWLAVNCSNDTEIWVN